MEATLPLISDNNKQTHNKEVLLFRPRKRSGEMSQQIIRSSKAQGSRLNQSERNRDVNKNKLKKNKIRSLGGAQVQPIFYAKIQNGSRGKLL